MEFMDLLFREYASPFVLLDNIIPLGQFCNFLDTFQKKHEEKTRWDFYLHKLSMFDNRSWIEFNHDLDFGTAKDIERPSDDVLVMTVKNSYNIMKNFNPNEQEGGD